MAIEKPHLSPLKKHIEGRTDMAVHKRPVRSKARAEAVERLRILYIAEM